MSFSMILKAAHRGIVSCALPAIRSLAGAQSAATKSFHSLCDSRTKIEPRLLQASSLPLANAVCGMKTKGRLNRRCRSCYFVARQGRLYIMCKTHPRHKQQIMTKKEENTWIMTHYTNGKRAWGRW